MAEPMTYGAQVPYMPKEQSRIIRAGLSIFELRSRGVQYHNKTIMGPFGASVHEYLEPGRPARAEIQWRTGFDTAIIYDADDEGNAIAWMVDDPWWHNRLHLMLDPWMNPVNRHTPNGIVPGFIVLQEIQAMRNILRTKVQTFEVWQDGRYKDYFFTDKEAKDWIEEKKSYALRMDVNGVKSIPLDKRKYEIKPGAVTEYRKEIKDLIDRSKQLQYGWTSSEEFTKKWKPVIIEEAKKLRGKTENSQVSVAPEAIANAIKTWTPEEREKFQKLLGIQGSSQNVDPTANPIGVGTDRKHTYNELKAKTKVDLLKILGGTEEEYSEVSRFELAKLIMERQEVQVGSAKNADKNIPANAANTFVEQEVETPKEMIVE